MPTRTPKVPELGTSEAWVELSLLADPVRRMIFGKLMNGPLPVNAITAGLPVGQSAVSQQLRKLKEAGLIEEERRGKYVLHAVVPQARQRLLAQIDAWRERLVEPPAGGGEDADATDHIDATMNSWATQWPRHDPLTVGIFLRLRLISDALEKYSARATARFGLNGVELRLLATLERIGPPHESTLSALSKITLRSLPLISKHLARVEKNQLIERLPNAQDGRSTLLRLTEKGRDVLHKVLEYQRIHELEAIYRIPAERREAIARMTRELLRKLGI